MSEFLYIIPRAKRAFADAFERNRMPKYGVRGEAFWTASALVQDWKGRTGEVGLVYLPDLEFSAPMVSWLVDACELSGVPFLCITDAHHVRRPDGEGYRGVLGRVIVNATGNPCDRREANIAYEFGPTGQNVETLVEAGIPEAEAMEILERFGLAPDAAPRP